jgi:parvulin-like peptidyl-prolyl isomerase
MQRHLLRLSLLLAGAALLAACGGGGSSGSLGSNDVALVSGVHITKQQFDDLMAQAKLSFKQNGRAFPKQGTTDYETVKSQVVNLLVQQAERQQKAKSLNINVTDAQITNRLNQIKKQYFGGSQKKYLAQLKKQQLTEAQVRDSIRNQLIATDLEQTVTKNIKVSTAEIHAYYLQHSASYAKPQSRDVRYILVKSKQTASTIYGQLKKAPQKATWCTLAKKYSQDPSSKNQCGAGNFSKGQTVPEFDKLLFSAPTNKVQAPIHSAQYGWFVIEPTSGILPKTITPEKTVTAQIKQTLLQQKQTTAVNNWATTLTKSYCSGSKVKYQAGYAPSQDPCAATTTAGTTTG